jgi:hypothetical protein
LRLRLETKQAGFSIVVHDAFVADRLGFDNGVCVIFINRADYVDFQVNDMVVRKITRGAIMTFTS